MAGVTPHKRLDESETLTLAIRYEAAYRADPMGTYQNLLGWYGKDNTNSIIKWMEATKFNCTIDESAGLAEDFNPEEAA